MIAALIFSVFSLFVWLIKRNKIASRITKNVTVLFDLTSAIKAIIGISLSKKYSLKRYALVGYYQREYRWASLHLVKTLAGLFSKRGLFLLTYEECVEFKKLHVLTLDEKRILFSVLKDNLQNLCGMTEQRFTESVRASLRENSDRVFAFKLFESVLESEDEICHVDVALFQTA